MTDVQYIEEKIAFYDVCGKLTYCTIISGQYSCEECLDGGIDD